MPFYETEFHLALKITRYSFPTRKQESLSTKVGRLLELEHIWFCHFRDFYVNPPFLINIAHKHA